MPLKENRLKKRRTDFDILFLSAHIEPPRFNIGLAPIYGVGSASLLSAVLQGGGFAFHGLGDSSAEKTEQEIRAIYQHIDKKSPFGINLFSHTPVPFMPEQLKRTQDYSRSYWQFFHYIGATHRLSHTKVPLSQQKCAFRDACLGLDRARQWVRRYGSDRV